MKLLRTFCERSAATIRRSESPHNPTWAAPTILEINSSREIPDSKPDHLGTNDASDKSLCTVGVPQKTRSFNRCNSVFVSCNSAESRASAMLKTRLLC